jgi:2-desacetyl-2-hydroxyethyl bacteriochlorophyllide A dehydrogenase
VANDRPTRPLIARAVSFADARLVNVVDVALEPPKEGEVLVRTLWSGISSGTEMLAYRGELDPLLPVDETIGALSGTFTYPFRYGYSCVGRVERSHARLREGDLVFAFQPHQDAFVARADDVLTLGDVDPRTATLFPLVEAALQAALDAGSVLGEDVVVTGLGAVGVLTALLLQRSGAHVLAAEPQPWRRALAEELGLQTVAPSDLQDAVSARTGGGVAVVIEATGRPETLADVLDVLAHEGEVLVVSWYGTKEARLPLGGHFHRRRLTIRSSQVSTIPARLSGRWTVGRRRAAARALLTELPVAALATHAYPLAQAAEAFAAVDQAEPGLMHAALCYA